MKKNSRLRRIDHRNSAALHQGGHRQERTTERAALSLEPPAVKRRICGMLCVRCCRLAVRHDDEAADRAAVLRSNGLNLDAIVSCRAV